MSRRPSTPLLYASAMFVLAGGYIHLREWVNVYRKVPSEVPGAEVVTIGFPVNAALSVIFAIALVVTIYRFHRFQVPTVVAAIVFQAGSLAALIQTRTGTLFGWTERIWDGPANQTRAVEIGALIALTGVLILMGTAGRLTNPLRSTTPANA